MGYRNPTDPPPDQPAGSPAAELEHHPAAALLPLLAVDRPKLDELVTDIDGARPVQPIALRKARSSPAATGTPPTSTAATNSAGSHSPLSPEYYI